MIQTLKRFTVESLFDAASKLLSKLNIQFDRETAEPIDVADLFDGIMPKYLTDALKAVENTYFIGVANDLSLQGNKSQDSLEDIADMVERGDKYDGMFIFACDAKPDANLTRSDATALTRAFNRIASANPVILLIRQNNLISLATCERTEFSSRRNQGSGEKLGKVNILRNINCDHPHRGHINILNSLGEKQFTTFEGLYQHWLTTFSNELLTKKFYSELSDWYAWAVQVARFPNDITTNEDDAKFNHEACIRLITRLIFVWFLKEKKLIPEEFFDEDYIKQNLIDNFNPHNRKGLLFFPEKSEYYRLVLQNLFFAMLNRPIVAEGKNTPNNRRFRTKVNNSGRNADYNVNNLMRYEQEFMDGGAKKFIALANSSVPFLNGGLFDCLDNKPNGLYYDGFSEREESLVQLHLPDYLFFGEEVGKGIDLSQWYGDKKKKKVSARGLIDILKRYSFTIEENTPLDQEVSLDPELLGKVFENLLAAYNPETQTSARKQTGSFYTPREIVQYMVDESLVAHLKRICGEELEPEYRRLLSYATEETSLSDEQRKAVMQAIYNCRVLDPACGSGAFPMGVLQQMVHVLRQIDPDNEMWHNFVIDRAIEKTKDAFGADDEEERKARLADIEEAFNRNINDPDYSRKLYLIENCIYGVDVQPIAVQISKLRFFISLVVDQNPTKDPKSNFAIRPLPNLESKFFAANTLIPLDSNRSLFTSTDDIQYYEKTLQELNHQLFLAKRNKDKQEIRQQMIDTRRMMAQTLENLGFLGADGYAQLTEWDMFDQNASSSFFDPEWMFGIKDGFDIVIANPPFVQIKKVREKDQYKSVGFDTFESTGDLYCLFYEIASKKLVPDGTAIFISSNKWLKSNYGASLRRYLLNDMNPICLLDLGPGVFENAAVDTSILLWSKQPYKGLTNISVIDDAFDLTNVNPIQVVLKSNDLWGIETFKYQSIKDKIEKIKTNLSNINVCLDYGILTGANKTFILSKERAINLITLDAKNKKIIKPILRGQDINRYSAQFNNIYLLCSHNGVKKEGVNPINIERDYPTLVPYFLSFGDQFINRGEQGDTIYNLRNCAYIQKFEQDKIIYADIVQDKGRFYYDNQKFYTNDTAFIITGSNLLYLTGLLNSSAFTFFYKNFYCGGSLGKKGLRYKRDFLLRVPIPMATDKVINHIQSLVIDIQNKKKLDVNANVDNIEQKIDFLVYHLYSLTYDEVLIIDPLTPIQREEYESYISESGK